MSGYTPRRKASFELIRHGSLLVWAFVALFPIYWMLNTSFKHPGEWVTWPPHWVPHEPTLENYAKILTPGVSSYDYRQTFTALKPLWDSLVIASLSSLVAVLLGTAMAYSVSRFRTGGRNFLYSALAIRMLPPVIIAIPFVVLYTTLETLMRDAGVPLKLVDTRVGLSVIYIASTLPYAIWMMVAFVEEIPLELEHAARLLGAGRLRVLRKIVVPLVLQGMLVTLLFVFILNWSELLLALTLTQTEVETITITLNKFQSANEGRDYGPQAAIGTVAVVPLVVLGLLIQKHLARGFSFGMVRR